MNYDYTNAFLEITNPDGHKNLFRKTDIEYIYDYKNRDGEEKTLIRVEGGNSFTFDGNVDEVLNKAKTVFL